MNYCYTSIIYNNAFSGFPYFFVDYNEPINGLLIPAMILVFAVLWGCAMLLHWLRDVLAARMRRRAAHHFRETPSTSTVSLTTPRRLAEEGDVGGEGGGAEALSLRTIRRSIHDGSNVE